MSLHVLAHPWEVQEIEEGTLVKLRPRDLNVGTTSVLTNELFELALEAHRPHLFLDFTAVNCLSSMVVGKLFALDRRLRAVGGRLCLRNLQPVVEEVLQAEGWPDNSTPA